MKKSVRMWAGIVLGLFLAGGGEAQVVQTGLSVHYRADNVDGAGTPGDGATTTLVNLANPGTPKRSPRLSRRSWRSCASRSRARCSST